MKYVPRILHISKTPLVGAPGKIVTALNRYTDFDAASIIGEDYPKGLAGLFLGESILYGADDATRSLCEELVRKADIIHVHNDLPLTLREMVTIHAGANAKFVYHVHSPLREGPLYFDRTEHLGFDWSAKLSIPHYPQRFFQDFRLVPNITLFKESLNLLSDHEPVRILFSPAHRRTGLRWGDKVSPSLEKALSAVQAMGLARVVDVKGMRPDALYAIRRTTHITIDEITTGAFHQISLEGLCAGNVVINGGDSFAVASLCIATRSERNPPFLRMTEDDIHERLFELLTDRERIRRTQRESAEYFREVLAPDRLIQLFAEIYREVMDA